MRSRQKEKGVCPTIRVLVGGTTLAVKYPEQAHGWRKKTY